MKISYVRGSLFDTIHKLNGESIIIPNVCNDSDKWGSGFTIEISKRWIVPRLRYHSMCRYTKKEELLGKIDLIPVEDNVVIVNMIAQIGIYNPITNKRPLDYYLLEKCLRQIRDITTSAPDTVSIHMPKIGTGHAHGSWDTIEDIINDIFGDTDIKVFVYIP